MYCWVMAIFVTALQSQGHAQRFARSCWEVPQGNPPKHCGATGPAGGWRGPAGGWRGDRNGDSPSCRLWWLSLGLNVKQCQTFLCKDKRSNKSPMFIIVYPCCSYMYWTGTCSLFAQLLAQVSRTHSRAGATIRCPATEVQRLPGLGLVPIRCPFIPINFEVAGFNCHVSSSLSISITVTRNAQLSKSKVQFPSPSSL